MGNETLVLDVPSASYFILNESASEVWDLILALGDLDLIIGELVSRYPDTDPVTVSSDLMQLQKLWRR